MLFLVLIVFWGMFHIFVQINRDSQLKSKHNLRNIFNQIYKLLYIRQIKFCYFSVTATEILSILFRLTQLRLKFILGKQTSQSGQ